LEYNSGVCLKLKEAFVTRSSAALQQQGWPKSISIDRAGNVLNELTRAQTVLHDHSMPWSDFTFSLLLSLLPLLHLMQHRAYCVLADAILVRFQYHFQGEQETNDLSKVLCSLACAAVTESTARMVFIMDPQSAASASRIHCAC
jgi:hypothetical protein